MLQLYGHPFAAFTWKVLIALYERQVPFEFRMLDPDHPENGAFVAQASPTGQFPVLVDGGIRRGTDILKAMALGAAAVLVGRPYIFGLAHAGAHGVAHVVRLLRDELEIAMALTGCRSLEDDISLIKCE